MYDMTAAHKEFPFGTKLRVTSLRNNKSAIVTINDRGPFIPGRDLDLSYAAARAIDLIGPGVERVRIEHIGRDVRYAKRADFPSASLSGPFTIQIGSFADEGNAIRLKQGIAFRYRDVYITTAYLNGQKFYRVRIGTFNDRDGAYSFAKNLAEEGYSTLITGKD